MKGKQPRVIVVTRPTPYDELLAQHGTRDQAKFFLATRDQDIELVEHQHRLVKDAEQQVLSAVPIIWRRSRLTRRDLDRYLFEPDDIVVAVGQDGLVANVAKYLDGQILIGINPDPGRNEGVLVKHQPQQAAGLLKVAAAGEGSFTNRTMVEATLDDGQRLRALNEIYVGHRTHQSARYELKWGQGQERHSSSGLIVATGTGASGWARSIHLQRRTEVKLPLPQHPVLVFFVREAWPSVDSQAELTEGRIRGNRSLTIISRMNDGGVAFGDGMESDPLEFNWGRQLKLSVAPVSLRLMN